MRPLDKGPIPMDGNGNTKTVKNYKHWRRDLVDRIGEYCAYCNNAIPESPQVEHVVPKNPKSSQFAPDPLDWDNLLLACGSCNSAKGDKPFLSSTHYMPEIHNTHLIFEYETAKAIGGNKVGLIPKCNINKHVDKTKSENTLYLFKLRRAEDKKEYTDRRWEKRMKAFEKANYALGKWQSGKIEEQAFLKELNYLLEGGFFSIWMHAFQGITIVENAILNYFPGTNMACFDLRNNQTTLIPLNMP